jgi:mRNA-degrading endonuclease HigB of HigAB toxin-antitoxin module
VERGYQRLVAKQSAAYTHPMGNRYKDSLFRSLFSDEDELCGLYNALKNTRYDKSMPITINTLAETLFTGGKNDISFSIGGKLVVLIEHVRYEVARLAA